MTGKLVDVEGLLQVLLNGHFLSARRSCLDQLLLPDDRCQKFHRPHARPCADL